MPMYRSENHRVITTRVGDIDRDEIVSSIEPLILTQDKTATLAGVQQVATGNDLRVFADIVRIRGPIVAPGRTIEIFARVVECEDDAEKKPGSINVDGLPGLAPADPPSKPLNPSPAAKGESKVRFLGINAKED